MSEETTDNVVVSLPERKDAVIAVSKAPGDVPGLIRFTASTGAEDRDGDTVAPDGWDLGNYLANPVFLWAHEYDHPPIGKAVQITTGNNALVMDIQFDMADEFAASIARKYAEGYLNAVSVGFRPKAGERRMDHPWGMHYTEQELLELSAVPVPSNPQALMQRGLARPDQVEAWDEQALAWVKRRGLMVEPKSAAPDVVVVDEVVIEPGDSEVFDDEFDATPEQPKPGTITDEQRDQLAAIASALGYALVPITGETDDTPADDADVVAVEGNDTEVADAGASVAEGEPVVLVLID